MSRGRLTSPAVIQRRLTVAHRAQKLRDRFRVTRLDRIAQIHAASLPGSVPTPRQAGSSKQKTSEVGPSKVFTDATDLESARGRFSECA